VEGGDGRFVVIGGEELCRRVRSPIHWVGGKGNFVSRLLRFIPEHRVYVEVFGGGASLLFAKERSPVEVYNDIDEGLVNFFRVLRDPEKFGRFYGKVVLTPYSRVEYNYCKQTWRECEDEVERAYRWFVVARQCFGGHFGAGWGFSINNGKRRVVSVIGQWLSVLEMLPIFHERFMHVLVECMDFRKIIPTYDTEETLFYCDPPYVLTTRRCKLYAYEMSEDDHRELVDLLLKVKGMVMLSGHASDIYKKLEDSGWVRKDFDRASNVIGRTRKTGILGVGSVKEKAPRVESVWLNTKLVERLNKSQKLLEVEL